MPLNDPTNVQETIQKILYISCRWDPTELHGETQELHDSLHNAQTNAKMIQQISKKGFKTPTGLHGEMQDLHDSHHKAQANARMSLQKSSNDMQKYTKKSQNDATNVQTYDKNNVN